MTNQQVAEQAFYMDLYLVVRGIFYAFNSVKIVEIEFLYTQASLHLPMSVRRSVGP